MNIHTGPSVERTEGKIAQTDFSFQIPIFYKLMVSMFFVTTIPMIRLEVVVMGSTNIIINIGIANSIFVITLITLSVVVMWSFFLASSITDPIVGLSKIATSMSS